LANTLAARQREKLQRTAAHKLPRQSVSASYHDKHRAPSPPRQSPPKSRQEPSLVHAKPKAGRVTTSQARWSGQVRGIITGNRYSAKPIRPAAASPARFTHRPPPPIIPEEPKGIRRDTGAFSSRYELYLFHKANGTLHEYIRMFGLD
jgi:hypothetical protein